MTVGLFPLGRVVITPPALAAFDHNKQLPVKFLARHLLGDFGDLGAEAVRANHYAILNDLRVRSKYTLHDGTPIYIITEADRSSTCLMLVSDD